MRSQLAAMQNNPAAIEEHFGRELAFGTAGMRGIIGPGSNRINCYIIRRVTQGLADYINQLAGNEGSNNKHNVVIAYDTRLYSDQFAEAAALVLAANGIKALLFDGIRPSPLLSYATRELGCAAGIVITASHNPPDYNGYKIYGPDGGQSVSPMIDGLIEAIKGVHIFDDVKTISRDEAVKQSLLEIIGPEIDRSYIEKVKALSLSSPDLCQKVAYTPLHGTGQVFIPDLLKETSCIDIRTVEEQTVADPSFSTVKVPNPEDPEALEMVLDKAREVGAKLVLATDPDCDRVGTAVRDEADNFVILSGNQVGALLLEYICSRLKMLGRMPENPVLVKNIVSSDLGNKIADHYGLATVETLIGFKYIAEKMNEFEKDGKHSFIFGYEESCGYLTGTFVRDKDAVIASFLIAEMCAYYKEQGNNLLNIYDQLQKRHGYHREDLFTVALKDILDAERHISVYENFPPEVNGFTVAEKCDYDKGKSWNLISGEETQLELPRSRILYYTMTDGSWFVVRPSGTEPKVKFYLSVTGSSAEEADQKLARLHKAVTEQG